MMNVIKKKFKITYDYTRVFCALSKGMKDLIMLYTTRTNSIWKFSCTNAGWLPTFFFYFFYFLFLFFIGVLKVGKCMKNHWTFIIGNDWKTILYNAVKKKSKKWNELCLLFRCRIWRLRVLCEIAETRCINGWRTEGDENYLL